MSIGSSFFKLQKIKRTTVFFRHGVEALADRPIIHRLLIVRC